MPYLMLSFKKSFGSFWELDEMYSSLLDEENTDELDPSFLEELDLLV